jgi:hypothetical protein
MFIERGFYNGPVKHPEGVFDYGHGICAVDSVYDRKEQTAIHLLIEDGRAAVIDTGHLQRRAARAGSAQSSRGAS